MIGKPLQILLSLKVILVQHSESSLHEHIRALRALWLID
jgi:hypothetical protein